MLLISTSEYSVRIYSGRLARAAGSTALRNRFSMVTRFRPDNTCQCPWKAELFTRVVDPKKENKRKREKKEGERLVGA